MENKIKIVKLEQSQLSFIIFKKTLQCCPNDEERKKDISKMIAFGIERGNNLEKIKNYSKPETSTEIKRLIIKYKLVSNAKNMTNAMTLSRICDTYPIWTCEYLRRYAKNPAVSFSKMESICKDYPKVMMTSAFAFLIPNKQDEFCLLLKKAHMVHQYEFSKQISGKNQLVDHTVNAKFMSDVNKHTLAAISGSIFPYDSQINSLKNFGVIQENENEFTVSEEVLEAVKVWEEMEKKCKETNLWYGFEFPKSFIDDYTTYSSNNILNLKSFGLFK